MYKIVSKAERGGIWDGSKVTRALFTTDKEAVDYFRGKGFLVSEVETKTDETFKKNVSELKKYAKEKGIDIKGKTAKEDILKAIEAAKK